MRKKRKIYHSLRYSFWDGVFASVQFGIIDQFYTPLALFLGAGTTAIGILNFIRNALVSILQIRSVEITRYLKSRKKLIIICTFLAAALMLPTFFIPFLLPSHRVAAFILLFGVTASLNLFAQPAWASLMSKYIPPAKRGQYFGWRGTVLGVVYSISVLLAGWLLYVFNHFNLFAGFAVLMVLASLARFISWFFLTKMHEPRWLEKKETYFSFRHFMLGFSKNNFARFSVLAAFYSFGVAMASPFVPVYFLQELKLDYLQYTCLMGAAVFTSLLTQQYWGKFSDRYGNMKIIQLTMFFITLFPSLFILSKNLYYLFIVQIFA